MGDGDRDGRASLLGYARVSTAEQSTQAQVDALNAAGVERVFVDTASGLRANRPALAELLASVQQGDTVVVARLDRLGRSLPELLRLVEDFAGRGVKLRSLGEQIDTSTAAGRLVLHVFGALAEFERAVMRERTVAGLASARARGRVGGRRPALRGARLAHARRLRTDGVPVWEIAQLLGVGRSTVYRTLSQRMVDDWQLDG